MFRKIIFRICFKPSVQNSTPRGMAVLITYLFSLSQNCPKHSPKLNNQCLSSSSQVYAFLLAFLQGKSTQIFLGSCQPSFHQLSRSAPLAPRPRIITDISFRNQHLLAKDGRGQEARKGCKHLHFKAL